MPIRAVSLDVGWTLAYPRESMWEILAELCCKAGRPVSAEETEKIVRSIWILGQERAQRELEEHREYTDSDEEFAGQFRVLGQLVFHQLGVEGDTEPLLEEFFARFWHPDQWQLFPDVPDALAALRARGLRVGVLSNAPSDMPRLLERLGVLGELDYVVVSACEGTRKPDRRIFARTLERAGVHPSEHVHVGDMFIEDILGGERAGVHTFLIERGRQALFPSFRESEGRALPAERVVSSLAEFVARLLG
jgi:putative hydrolase of the HAD superfamily